MEYFDHTDFLYAGQREVTFHGEYGTKPCVLSKNLPPPSPREAADSGIRSTLGRYASYWNAFLFSTISGHMKLQYFGNPDCRTIVIFIFFYNPGSFYCAIIGTACYIIGIFMLLIGDEDSRPPADVKARLALLRRQKQQKLKSSQTIFTPLQQERQPWQDEVASLIEQNKVALSTAETWQNVF